MTKSPVTLPLGPRNWTLVHFVFTKTKVLSFGICVLAKEEGNINSKKHTEFLRDFYISISVLFAIQCTSMLLSLFIGRKLDANDRSQMKYKIHNICVHLTRYFPYICKQSGNTYHFTYFHLQCFDSLSYYLFTNWTNCSTTPGKFGTLTYFVIILFCTLMKRNC